MKELLLEEIKEIELELLSEFDQICRNEGFRYSLGGGTLLGAVRHKGFIPWDDDIDVMMPREDYDQFVKFCNEYQSDSFCLISYETQKKYQNLYAKAIHPQTKLVDETITIKDYPMGVFIDIFPLDGLGNNYKEAYKNFRKTALKRELLNAKTWKKYTKSKTHVWYYEPIRLLLFLSSRFLNSYKLLLSIDKINRQIKFDDSKVAACVCGSYREKEIMDTSIFKEYTELLFEDKEFKAIKGYDAYLSRHYGNYKTLPPEDKRQTHHTYKAYRKESF